MSMGPDPHSLAENSSIKGWVWGNFPPSGDGYGKNGGVTMEETKDTPFNMIIDILSFFSDYKPNGHSKPDTCGCDFPPEFIRRESDFWSTQSKPDSLSSLIIRFPLSHAFYSTNKF
jgi:hypothetical protein